MARKKQIYYAVADGKPLALGLHGIFGYRSGVLLPCKDEASASKFNSTIGKEPKALTKAIERTIKCQRRIKDSVIFDWELARPLTALGVISTKRFA